MPKKNSGKSARQIRREQQRAAAPPLPVIEAPPLSAPSEMLGPSVLAPVFATMIVVGSLLYRAHGFARLRGNELSAHQSLFTAVNAATLTGFQQAANPDNYTPAGQVLTLLLMVAGILFTFIGCGLAVTRIARLAFKDRDVILWAVGSILFAGLAGGLGLLGGGRTFFDGIFQGISALGNCGLTLGPLSDFSDGRALLVLFPLIVLGGIGLPVLMDVYHRLRSGSALSEHSRVTLKWIGGTYLVITLILFLVRWPGTSASLSFWRSAFVQASEQAINTRSAGFAFEDGDKLPQATTFVLIFVMMIGAGSGGTSGGMKVTTFALLTNGVRGLLTGKLVDRRFGVALQWLFIYVLMLLVATVALLISEPQIHLDRTLFLAASALGNVGLSYNPIDVSTAGLYLLSATMMLGRIAPMMMLWHLIDTTPNATVAVG